MATCTCKAYDFPHRTRGGRCKGEGPYCESCGEACRVIDVDFGYGRLEYWGTMIDHVDIRPASDCCEAGIKGEGHD